MKNRRLKWAHLPGRPRLLALQELMKVRGDFRRHYANGIIKQASRCDGFREEPPYEYLHGKVWDGFETADQLSALAELLSEIIKEIVG